MAEPESAIKGLLEAYSDNLSSATAVWAKVAPQDAVKPYAVFEVDDVLLTEVMGGSVNPAACFFTVSIYADEFLKIVQNSATMLAGMSRYAGTIGGVVVQSVFFEGRNDDFDDGDREYVRELNFKMFYEE